MNNVEPKVAIIIPNYNGLEFLKNTINSIFLTTKYPYRIIFVDAGSTDGSREFIKELAQKHFNISYIFEKKKEGTTKAYNKGIKATEYNEDVFLTQNDVLFPLKDGNCWLGEMARISKEKKVGIVTTKNSINYAGPTYLEKLPYVGTWCLYLPRKTINMIGLLDENYSPGPGDDIDYSFRVVQMGLILATTTFDITHHRHTFHEYDQEKIKDEHAIYFRKKWRLDEKSSDFDTYIQRRRIT